MRTVPFSTVLRRTCGLMGVLPDDLTTEEWLKLCAFCDARLKSAWHREDWPALVRVERRFFRPDWDSTETYAARAEVFYPNTQQYFQSLQSSNLNHSPTSSVWWAECSSAYSADNWASATAYTVGDQVYYLVTGEFYQCHTAHTSGGTLTPDATGADARWGILTPFLRTVDLDQAGQTAIGLVLGAYETDPRIPSTPYLISFVIEDDHIQVGSGINVWLRFLTAPNSCTGDVWDPAAAYVAGERVYFEAQDHSWDFWTALDAVAAAESPITDPDLWHKEEIPAFLEPYLAIGAYVDWLTMDGQHDKSVIWEKLAEKTIADELDKLYRLQGQVPRLEWRI